jgi:XTP/dITP diphosphohydrolase
VTREIVIASKNKGKIREIRQIYADLPVAIVENPDLPEVVEDGDSFSANARKKAVEIARHTGKWALADDSGLEVDALRGAPGIHSARWSGGGDEANNDKLIAELRDVPAAARTAR